MRWVSRRRDSTERRVVFPLPEAPMIPHRPPETHPRMLLMIYFIGFPRFGLVETETLFHDSTAGADSFELVLEVIMVGVV